MSQRYTLYPKIYPLRKHENIAKRNPHTTLIRQEKYYRLLGLNASASVSDIKKAYRKLALRLHPDYNNDKDAHAKFIRITEAYESLLSIKSGDSLHIMQQNREKQRRQAKIKYEQFLKAQVLENERYYQSLFIGKPWKIIKGTSIIGSLVSILILLDRFLPLTQHSETATYYAKNIYGGPTGEPVSLIVTDKGNEYWVSNLENTFYRNHPHLFVMQSAIFQETVELRSIGKTEIVVYPIAFTFYSFFWIIVPLILVPLGIRLFKRRSIYYSISYHFALYFSTVLLLIYITVNHHWIHLFI